VLVTKYKASVANNVKDFLLSNGTVERRISEVADDTDTELTEEIKKFEIDRVPAGRN
jgi:hypothetical protein